MDGKDIDKLDRRAQKGGTGEAGHGLRTMRKKCKADKGKRQGQKGQPPKYNHLSWAEFCQSTSSLLLPLLLRYPHVILIGDLDEMLEL